MNCSSMNMQIVNFIRKIQKMTFEKTTKTCSCFLKIKMVSYHTIEINAATFNRINNVHEKITRFWLTENDYILM